ALKTDQLSIERGRENLRHFRLADAGLAFEKQRPAESEAQENDRGERAIADIGSPAEQAQGFVDRGRKGRRLPGQGVTPRQQIAAAPCREGRGGGKLASLKVQ